MTYPNSFSFKSFIEISNDQLLEYLKTSHVQCMNQQASNEQIKAWINSIKILKSGLTTFCKSNQGCFDYSIVLEYELPRERGRRPDVLLLFKSSVIVIEFKERPVIEKAFVDQVSAYTRDLNNYHEYSHNLIFTSVLLMTSLRNVQEVKDGIICLSPDNLDAFLNNFWKEESKRSQIINSEKWVEGDYLPLPSLIQAARLIFQHEPLPSIKRATSAGIPETIRKLKEIAYIAKQNKEHHLALITGVPGAGKTLVGISFVYENFSENDTLKEAVFLSGNGPLVEVLQYALNNKIFVQDVHGFLKKYGGGVNKSPMESVIIFDEAQRAWDREKVRNSPRGHDKSEPDDFLEIGKKKEWCLFIGLIGEGQEIYLGEEGGIAQWNDAILASGIKWNVCCPQKLKDIFYNSSSLEIIESLNLTKSLRSHLADDLQRWVTEFLEGNYSESIKLSLMNIKKQQFDIYVTRDLNKAKEYVQTRYQNEPEKRYGLIASSKSSILPKYGIQNDFLNTRNVKKGPWYIDDKESPLSCCQFRHVMTEFGCQGLELDFPIVCWENDFIWNDNTWVATKTTKGAKDSFQLRKNSYRVLLSRGRDGLIIFIANENSLDSTYYHLKSIGITDL